MITVLKTLLVMFNLMFMLYAGSVSVKNDNDKSLALLTWLFLEFIILVILV